MNQEMKDILEKEHHDESQWGDPVPPPARIKGIKKKRLDAMVSIRLTPEELAKLQLRAENAGLTLSSFLRRIALTEVVQIGIDNCRLGDSVLNITGSATATPAIYSSPVFKVQLGSVPTFAGLTRAS